jgi:8-oxo-dGTP pyrophosphatase MutT (NUDIX family)
MVPSSGATTSIGPLEKSHQGIKRREEERMGEKTRALDIRESKNYPIVYCAGGIVWRTPPGGEEVLLIHSRSDQAWKFPKGHIDPDDPSWDAAAQREVAEETGYQTIITDFAGYTKYPVQGVPKVVLYWHMTPIGECRFEPSEEVEAIGWLPIPAALTFEKDRDFLRALIQRPTVGPIA